MKPITDARQVTLLEFQDRMVFGSDQPGLDTLLDRLVTPTFRQRTNGEVFDRESFPEHVRQMRTQVDGGQVEVLDRLVDGDRLAFRLLFTITLAAGGEAALESTVLADMAEDGRIEQIVEVARFGAAGDSQELLRS